MKTEKSVVVEPARFSDIGALLEIEQAVFVPADGMLTRRSFRRHIQSRHLLLVARGSEPGTEVAGYVLVFVHTRSARIYSLAVHPRYQGRGLARTLLEAVLEALRARPLDAVKLEVRKTNCRARGLYESLGFEVTQTRPDYYGPNEDAICMSRAIRPPASRD